MQLGSMFISNCNNTLNVSDAFCAYPQEHLKTVVTALSAEAIDLGRPYWIPHPISCHRPEAVTTVFKCLVRKPSALDVLIGYFTPSHVIHQRLLLQFLSA